MNGGALILAPLIGIVGVPLLLYWLSRKGDNAFNRLSPHVQARVKLVFKSLFAALLVVWLVVVVAAKLLAK